MGGDHFCSSLTNPLIQISNNLRWEEQGVKCQPHVDSAIAIGAGLDELFNLFDCPARIGNFTFMWAWSTIVVVPASSASRHPPSSPQKMSSVV
ncbi:hypothetical protein MKX08_009329 [Trichoderma sp. CBMAI-0020]|nr:hypothetical protein MKX08_009329 [Trichoderma sp. CBMAI-0020]